MRVQQFGTLASISLLLTIAACGKAKKSEAVASLVDQVSNDQNVLDDVDSAHSEAALDALAEPKTVATALALAPLNATPTATFDKTCTAASDGSAKVVITSTFQRDQPKKGNAVTTLIGSGTETRNWSQTGQTLACNTAGKSVVLNWGNVAGLTNDIEFSRKRERKTTITRKRETRVIESTTSSAGTRKVTWSTTVTPEGSNVRLHKTVTLSQSQERKIRNASGKELEIKIAMTTKTPLEIDVIREAAAPFTVSTKTIQSGTIAGTYADGSRAESTYTDFKGVFTADGCTIESGKKAISHFAKDATTANKSHETTVTAGVAIRKDLATGEESEVETPACDPTNLE